MASAAQLAIMQQTALVESTLHRIVGHRGVAGYVVMSKEGSVMRAVGFEDNRDMVKKYATRMFQFTQLAHSVVRTLDFDDELTFLRMRWRHREIILAPDSNREYILLVVHDKITEAEDLVRKAQAQSMAAEKVGGAGGQEGGASGGGALEKGGQGGGINAGMGDGEPEEEDT